MSDPITVSRAAHAADESVQWDAFIGLIAGAVPADLTPVQRVAHLAWWYSSEVLNGGHDQYLGSGEEIDHREVINALTTIGARCQADVLAEALTYFREAATTMPDDYAELLRWQEQYGYAGTMGAFDRRFHACRPPIEASLRERYLRDHEPAFIRWVP